MQRRTNFDNLYRQPLSASQYPLKRGVDDGYRAPPSYIRRRLHEDLSFNEERLRMAVSEGREADIAYLEKEIAGLRRQLGLRDTPNSALMAREAGE